MTAGDERLQRWTADAMPLAESLLAVTHTAMADLGTGPEPLADTWIRSVRRLIMADNG